ncbi:hypothetical protein G3570_15015 [Balneolaceae bacterium YR4-1]|uniref:Uncharacterized protein n=1 Tax=Halalkalibaculum roseum TaxID=2709311 RepID=A0A6M1SZX2_9BACT|nr:hypothetical protein [Halalkalibaculum roseum]NGP77958.1 hypothetical protein [Halalkalibaculum roseum]
MPDLVEKYKLGDIEVTIEETEKPNKYSVVCNDGNYRSSFTIRKYEYENYKRHMNQRIKNAFKEEYGETD